MYARIEPYLGEQVAVENHVAAECDRWWDRDGVVLRQQLSILQRKLNSPIKPNRAEKMTLAVLKVKLKRIGFWVNAEPSD